MNDELKSVEKTAEATRDIIVRLSDFFDKYLGSPAVQMGEIAGDWMKYFRYKNMLAIFDKVQKLHRQRKLAGKPIPLSQRIAIPLLEAASAEDDETLQELWANLITNSTDPSTSGQLHPSFIEIIKQLTPYEAKIIQLFSKAARFPTIYVAIVRIDLESTDTTVIYYNIYAQYINACSQIGILDENVARMHLDNLKRLGIVEIGFNTIQSVMKSPKELINNIVQERHEYLAVTQLGMQFINSCII
jgi:hypothetical protein